MKLTKVTKPERASFQLSAPGSLLHELEQEATKTTGASSERWASRMPATAGSEFGSTAVPTSGGVGTADLARVLQNATARAIRRPALNPPHSRLSASHSMLRAPSFVYFAIFCWTPALRSRLSAPCSLLYPSCASGSSWCSPVAIPPACGSRSRMQTSSPCASCECHRVRRPAGWLLSSKLRPRGGDDRRRSVRRLTLAPRQPAYVSPRHSARHRVVSPPSSTTEGRRP